MVIIRWPNRDARLRLCYLPTELNKLVLLGLLANSSSFCFFDRVFFLNASLSIFLSFLFLFFAIAVYSLGMHVLFFVCLSYVDIALRLVLLMDL